MPLLKKPKGIVIHHSATKDGMTVDWVAIKRYHMQTNGWSDIGYHFGVELTPDGLQILRGRPTTSLGAHTAGKNDMLGICLVGDYDKIEPDEARLNTLAQLVAALLKQFPDLTTNDIHRHSEYAPKSCPGRLFPWAKFIAKVKALVKEK